jgi:tetratricopeptide (TPR) repeat protein
MSRERIMSAGLGLLLLLLLWQACRPGFTGPFVFDDTVNIADIPAVQWSEFSWDMVRETWTSAWLPARFVANATFGLNHLAGGLDPAGYHHFNWWVHVLTGLALLWVGWLYAGSVSRGRDTRWVGLGILAATGLFLLHPLAVQAVTYIVQRMTTMAALFDLLAFGLYLDARRRNGSHGDRSWRYALAVLAWLAACFSKETAYVLPVVILAHEACFYRPRWAEKLAGLKRMPGGRWLLAGAAAAAVTCGAVLWKVLHLSSLLSLGDAWPNRDYNGLERILTQARVQVLYLTQLVWPAPSRLNLDHDLAVSRGLLDPWTTLPAWMFWALAGAAVLWLAWKKPAFGFPALVYLLCHAIESGPVNLELVFEHRMYQPMTALVLLVAAGAAAMTPDRRKWLVVTLVVLWVPLSYATWQRNVTWGDPVAFHYDCANKAPGKFRPWYNLGTLLGPLGRLDEARAALEKAIAIQPDDSQAHNQLGNVYLISGNLHRAEAEYREAVRLESRNAEAVYNVALALDRQGRAREAIVWYERFIAQAPPHLRGMIPQVRSRIAVLGLRTG